MRQSELRVCTSVSNSVFEVRVWTLTYYLPRNCVLLSKHLHQQECFLSAVACLTEQMKETEVSGIVKK